MYHTRRRGLRATSPQGCACVTVEGMPEQPVLRRESFTVLRPIPTRWMDNDHYGHVNNVAYYSFFDTAVNGFLMDETGIDIRTLPAIGVVAESGCRFLSGASFPDTIYAGLAVERLGTTSVAYRLALFRGADDQPCAVGKFVHVYVDEGTRRPVPIPAVIRAVLERLHSDRPQAPTAP
jgi:acyl-CoA thioester hydrolase